MIYKWNSLFNKTKYEILHKGALTSLALYGLYRTDTAQTIIDVRSHVEFLIPSGNVIVLFWHFKFTWKINFIGRL